MTYRDAFLGRLRDQDFNWSDPSQKLDQAHIEFLTPSLLDERIFRSVQTEVKAGAPSRQLDWGSWAVPVTRSQMLEHIAPWEIGWDLPGAGDEQHKPRNSRRASKLVIEAMSGAEPYILVIEEY